MKVAIVGAGFFGLTLGLFLSKNIKFKFLKKKFNLQGASSANQFRFHLGYHYPRSQKTVREINKSKDSFVSFYGSDVFGKTSNYYLLANDSLVKFDKYRKFLKKNNLYFKLIKNSYNKNIINKNILSNEKILNYFTFIKKILSKIKQSNLIINFNTEFKKTNIKNFDKVIITTYANNNLLLKKLGIKKLNDFKFELVEKILIKLPQNFLKKVMLS